MKRTQNMKVLAMFFAALACASVASAETARISWKTADGKWSSEDVPLEKTATGFSLTVGAEALKAKNAVRFCVLPDFAVAHKGEPGYWVFPDGRIGSFREDNGSLRLIKGKNFMPMYGMKTPRATWVAIVKGLPWYYEVDVVAKDGRYTMSAAWSETLARCYEDLVIEWTMLGADAGYPEMAKVYRDWQIGRGEVKPLRERVKGNPTLKYAVESSEVRIRQAWKPVPSPVKEQVPENEPAMRVKVPFDRVGQIVDEMKAQGVPHAEICLVGWNYGGHDGHWPQAFPVEPALGGEVKLRELAHRVRDAGYCMTCHANLADGYIVSDCWDAEWTIKGPDGRLKQGHEVFWSGGRPYGICPRRAYERFATRDVWRIAALGFRGMGYWDVFTCVPVPTCDDPRHRVNEREAVGWQREIFLLVGKAFGAAASEGAFDHLAGCVDSVLYANFLKPFDFPKGLADGIVPMYQLVYNGITVQNPFTATVNFTAQTKQHRLKFIEFGGRPNFYFYSRFVDDGTDWMGAVDLTCENVAEMKRSVALIKEGCDIYDRLSYLQYEFMTGHAQLADGVYRTAWEDGSEVVVNYSDRSFAYRGEEVAPLDWRLYGGAGR